jgi:hypothetical protein
MAIAGALIGAASAAGDPRTPDFTCGTGTDPAPTGNAIYHNLTVTGICVLGSGETVRVTGTVILSGDCSVPGGAVALEITHGASVIVSRNVRGRCGTLYLRGFASLTVAGGVHIEQGVVLEYPDTDGQTTLSIGRDLWLSGDVPNNTGQIDAAAPSFPVTMSFHVGGDLEMVDYDSLRLGGDLSAFTIGGNLLVERAAANATSTYADAVSIGRNATIRGARGDVAGIDDSSIGGSLTFDANQSNIDNHIGSNTIGRSLVCAGNTPAPIGGSNTVGRHRRGQCAGL